MFVNISNKQDLRNGFLLVLLSLVVRFVYFFYMIRLHGEIPLTNDTDWYLDHAYDLFTNFKIEFDFNGVFYFGYYALLSVLLFILKKQILVIIFQIIVNAFTVLLVYNIAYILFNRKAAFIAGLFYSFTLPLAYWSMFILTDSLFISLLLLNTYLLLKLYINFSFKKLMLFILCSIWLVIFRPTGIVSLTFIFIYIIINFNKLGFFKFVKKFKAILLLLIVFASVILGFLITSSNFAALTKSLYFNLYELFYTQYAKGKIFDLPTAYDYKYNAIMTQDYFNNFVISFIINNWKSIIIIYARSITLFWAVAFWNFTVSKLYFLAAYLFGFFGVFYVIKDKIMKKTSIIFLIILSIQFFCMVFFIDSQFRYRVPALVFLNFIAAYGVDRFLDIIITKIRTTRRRKELA